ncbi:MAG TPA: hypothetical protein VGR26_08890 [Acidimicrobiales bacterium]|nr:hypothetical protein [Acidimicrobiales bacterium]
MSGYERLTLGLSVMALVLVVINVLQGEWSGVAVFALLGISNVGLFDRRRRRKDVQDRS